MPEIVQKQILVQPSSKIHQMIDQEVLHGQGVLDHDETIIWISAKDRFKNGLRFESGPVVRVADSKNEP